MRRRTRSPRLAADCEFQRPTVKPVTYLSLATEVGRPRCTTTSAYSSRSEAGALRPAGVHVVGLSTSRADFSTFWNFVDDFRITEMPPCWTAVSGSTVFCRNMFLLSFLSVIVGCERSVVFCQAPYSLLGVWLGSAIDIRQANLL